MERELKIALPKGYLFKECLSLLDKAGYDTGKLRQEDRKLVIESDSGMFRYVICRPMDVPVYVEYGACDIGFCGKDVLAEKESRVYELSDLKIGKCRLVLATVKDEIQKVKKYYQHFGSLRVATSYPNIAEKYFNSKGIQAEIIKLYGSVELAPVLGMAEEIVDITSTGKTLAENNLVEMDNIMESSTRLVANIAGYKLKYDVIKRFMERIKKAI
jgi:ATP phosphoribosyltransferase